MTSHSGIRIWNAISTVFVASTLAGCTSNHKMRNANSQPDEATRGMRPEFGRLGFDHALQVRRSKNAAPHELHDRDTVMSGDRIRVTVATSEDAYLYLAFCASHELAVYPSERGVRTRAGNLTLVPEGDGELVIDRDPGPEVLYLILSRTELSLADPHLAGAIAATDHGAKRADCDADLDTNFTKPVGSVPPKASGPSPMKNVLRGDVVHKKPPPGDPDFARSPGKIVWYGVNGPNGLGEVVAADADGIAVVRYGFTHIAPTSPP